MLRLKNIKNPNPYSIGETVEFLNRYGYWVKGVIVDFKITDFVYKAVIKCKENKCCRKHYICICSLYLRKSV
jgi:hypothetical protein